MQLTDDQIIKLSNLGVKTKTKTSVVPLLSISGLSLISVTGLILLKTKQNTTVIPDSRFQIPDSYPSPTQVPKSIQHYLLASQTYFSQALQLQQENDVIARNEVTKQSQTVNLINQAILAAAESIKLFPQDYRGYEQRGRIYQSLCDSQPQLIDPALTDFSQAAALNPTSSETLRQIASLYAKKGDVPSTIHYLVQTISLEPTKAQNFYDLARLQQQTGQIPEALSTYNRLIPLLTDQTQIKKVTSEKSALESLLSQNKEQITDLPVRQAGHESPITTSPSPSTTFQVPGTPLLEASRDSQLIIAAPETDKKISVSNQSDSNALSGNSTLLAGSKQITITNSQVSSTSQIYLTITKGGKNQNLQLLSKQSGSFIVGLDLPISEDIEFKWWIIN